MVRALILALLLVMCSCSGSCGGGNGKDAEVEDQDYDEGVEPDISIDDGIDEAMDVSDVADADTPQEPEVRDCAIPIRDCGEACRQVTCAAEVAAKLWEPWDVFGSVISYYSLTGDGATAIGLYQSNIVLGVEQIDLEYPGPDYESDNLAKHGNFIAYELWKVGSYDACKVSLHVFDTDLMRDEILLCSSGETIEEIFNIKGLDMYGSNIVWYGKDEGDVLDGTDLFMYDLALREKRRLTTNESCYNPSIWEGTVACTGLRDSPDGSLDIILRDLETNTPVNITAYPGDQDHASLWQDRVAWTDFRAEQCADIYWCDLPDCEAQPAVTDPTCQYMPAVEGSWIVWHDFRNDVNPLGYGSPYHDNIELWGYNIETGLEYQLGSFNDLVGNKLRIENGKLYFMMTAVPNDETLDSLSIFEIDLSYFL